MSYLHNVLCGQVKILMILHIRDASAFPSVFALFIVLVWVVFYYSPAEIVGLNWIWVVYHSVLHNFVSIRYLENKSTEVYPILYMR